jgi:hypothetical protein
MSFACPVHKYQRLSRLALQLSAPHREGAHSTHTWAARLLTREVTRVTATHQSW